MKDFAFELLDWCGEHEALLIAVAGFISSVAIAKITGGLELRRALCVRRFEVYEQAIGQLSLKLNVYYNIQAALESLKDKDSYGIQIEENIVVELKAPNITLSKKVLRQVEDYMDFIRSKPQFNSQYRRWKFIAIAKKVDDDIKNRYETFKDKGKPGLVNITNNYEIYALTWDDVFKMFDLRHSFMLDKLKYDRDEIAKEINDSFSEGNRDTANALAKKAICEIA